VSFSIIAAIGQNNELGKKGGLCFHIPSDLKFFKETTIGHPCFMGLATFKSLPKKLPGRTMYVLSFSADDVIEEAELKGALVNTEVIPVTDLNSFIAEYENSDQEIFVIGGGSVYKQLLPHCQKLYLTEIDATDPDADTFFPDFNHQEYLKETLKSGDENNLHFNHILYTKK